MTEASIQGALLSVDRPVRRQTQYLEAVVVFSPLRSRENLDDRSGQAYYFSLVVEAVVVPYSAAPSDPIQAVPESVGVLVVAGLPKAFSRNVHVVIGGAEVPRQGDIVVSFPEICENLLSPSRC